MRKNWSYRIRKCYCKGKNKLNNDPKQLTLIRTDPLTFEGGGGGHIFSSIC